MGDLAALRDGRRVRAGRKTPRLRVRHVNYIFTSVDIDLIDAPPDAGQRKRDGGGRDGEDGALAHGEEVQHGNGEDYVGGQEDPAVRRDVRAGVAVAEVTRETAHYRAVQLDRRQSLEKRNEPNHIYINVRPFSDTRSNRYFENFVGRNH